MVKSVIGHKMSIATAPALLLPPVLLAPPTLLALPVLMALPELLSHVPMASIVIKFFVTNFTNVQMASDPQTRTVQLD